ncbi:hypothetical protein [Psychroserpens algicola]|uniref:Uncharacterized protein n=1 Tax=Psychroserpens algicola TaxID=1719034 RepID=A0ABT0H4M4_9FLAO|nr:hypothetical protein [Psychroserpens algicola]MCK8479326.1 hypothetical protein [Psychroserpens algicola]
MLPFVPKLVFKLKNLFSEDISVTYEENDNLMLISKETMSTGKQLQASLKHLEFISFFETHIDVRKADSYSLNFLLELERIKYDSQINTIKLIEYQKS